MVSCQNRLPSASMLKLIGGAARDIKLSASPVIVLLHAQCAQRTSGPERLATGGPADLRSPPIGDVLLDLVDPDQGRRQFAGGIPLVLTSEAEAVVILDEIDQTRAVGHTGIDTCQHDRGQV